jgi:heat shock protein HslJ
MRKRALFVLVIGVAAIVAACAGGSSLTGKTWQLTAITEKVPAFQGVVPAADQPNYTIEFKSDGSFNAKADCNQLSGSYTTTSSGGLTIVPGPMTLAICPEGSLSQQYVAALGQAASYAIASGELTITLTDGGTLVYK